MGLVTFMSGRTGPAARIVVGVALIAVGLAFGGVRLVLSIVGLVPLVAGAPGLCLLAPLFHLRLHGTGSPEA